MNSKKIEEALQERILILDGAMGTAIQQKNLPDEAFCLQDEAGTDIARRGNNDLLCITRPEVVRSIHQAYIDAGADIITTNTFGANRISQKEYGMAHLAARMNIEGAAIARQAADNCKQHRVWVAGSMGPTSKTLSLATDMNHPELQDVDFESMAQAYHEQAKALMAGGADMLLLETCFDALNTKAALYAILQLNNELGRTVPVMVSATINDRSGRTLTGQTLEAFYTSIAHYPILSFGINCSFGVTELRPFIERLAAMVPRHISLYPNAGLPNEMGEYDEMPEFTARHIKDMAEAGLLNIAGGCCGTNEQHIKAIADALQGVAPRKLPLKDNRLVVSGLERVVIDKATTGFINIGERTNVAGSRKFARLIAEKNYTEAATVAAKQIESGAPVIDINMDDAMLDSAAEMQCFLRYISNEPAVAQAALMIDSSDWDTIIAGLRNAQGKCIVNSISLKNGEEDFLAKARSLRAYGAAVVVMAFDEEGQAVTYQRKTDICQRAYRLLTEKADFPPQDIIFDVNVLSVGTGIEAHANYGIDFIRAVEWIKHHLPEAKTSGGISNLSFAFRGNNPVREAMHSAFLYHAISAGLDMAIMNPSMIQVYEEIDKPLLKCVEDVILNREADATDRLIAMAERIKNQSGDNRKEEDTQAGWRSLPTEQRIAYDLSKGSSEYLQDDMLDALNDHGGNAVAVIEGPLMRGMEYVGRLFAEGKMFLPQVVKSAKVMKDAVAILQPHIDMGKDSRLHDRPCVVIATAKGDVHDIGKNIVAIVLACNNFEIIDLGVMVDNEKILETAKEKRPILVAVSGLITPSLKEMENLCRLFEKQGMTIPILVGGATTTAAHTAIKLAPLYKGQVIYGGDASRTALIAKRLLTDRENMLNDIAQEQEQLRNTYARRHVDTISDEEAYRRRLVVHPYPEALPLATLHDKEEVLPLPTDVEPLIDWRMFLLFWGFRGETLQQILVNPEARKTLAEGKEMLQQVMADGSIQLKWLVRFFCTSKQGNNLVFDDRTVMPMQRMHKDVGTCLSLVDFIPDGNTMPVGIFCASAMDAEQADDHKSYRHLMRHALCARLAEAAVEWGQRTIYGKRPAIRPAFGYATCPDHSLKGMALALLDAEQRIGVKLTENYSIIPSTTVCGMFIEHPEARYFSVGKD